MWPPSQILPPLRGCHWQQPLQLLQQLLLSCDALLSAAPQDEAVRSEGVRHVKCEGDAMWFVRYNQISVAFELSVFHEVLM